MICTFGESIESFNQSRKVLNHQVCI